MIPNKKSSRVNWAKLYPDLLRIISKKLFDISSFICFRAVCKRWRSATRLSDPPVQFPWLIDWPRCKGKLDFTFRFYSINTHKTHTFEVPDAHIYGPSDGRVMLYECYRCSQECQSFLNPLSWEEQFLPLEVPVDNLRPISLWRKNLKPSVVYLQEDDSRIFCSWHSEKNKWTNTRFPRTRTVAFYDHKFFVAVPSSKRITVIDEASGVVLSDIPHPSRDFYNGYLIATDDGLLAVEISILVSPFLRVDDLQKCEFDVYRLENYPRNPHWNKLSGIGDLMVFVDKNSGFSLKASDFGAGFRGNCIYFITKGNKPNRHGSEHVIGRFDIGLNKTEKMLTPRWLGNRTWERQAAWFMPTLN
ncbi:F-box protein [Carex littledalei]|uniref:F-box protein n=1 Tax=Carex littledalei TaxID=544730 RepID=A0A833R4Q3_9POAL|nr:F-box protein [Carex littledalei]